MVEKLIHISDIHIRLNDRHDEYKLVFDRLYDYINSIEGNSVIVLTGDIVHNKLDITSELIDVTYDFLYNLSIIKQMVCIPGNHDMNIKNMHRYDPLSMVIHKINKISSSKINYLYDNSNFVLDNINFTHIPFFKEEYNDIIIEDKINIALYHGDISGCTYDTNMKSKSSTGIDIFSKYDYTLLGDIHNRQFINDNIAYAGSLIQQNKSEDVFKHGGIVWDLVNNNHIEFDIHNDFGFYTSDINGDFNEILKNKPNISIEIQHSDNDIEDAINLKDTLISQGKSPREILLLQKQDIKNIIVNSITETDVTALDSQLDIIRDMLSKDDNINNDIISEILDLHKGYYKNNINVTNNISNIKINKISFKNMFSYVGENTINIDTYSNSILGIIGKNGSGKSSILDIITFAIYDTTCRTNKSSDVINKISDDMYVYIEFDVDGNIYTIERNGKRKKNGDIPVNVDFKINGISHNGDKRSSTNKVIQSYFGNIDDFLLISFISQKGGYSFYDLTQSEKKDILIKLLGLDIFDSIKEDVSIEYKSIEKDINSIKNMDIDGSITNTELLINEEETNIKLFTEEVDSLSSDIDNTSFKLIELKNKIKPVIDIETNFDIDKSQLEINEINKLISNIDENQYKQKISSLSDDIKHIESEIDDDKELFNKSCEYISENKNVEHKIELLNRDIKNNNKKIKEHQAYILEYSDYTYNSDCKECIANNKLFFSEIQLKKEDIFVMEINNKEYIEKISELNDILSVLGETEEFVEEYRSKTIKLNYLNKEYNSLIEQERLIKSKKETLQNKLNLITDKIDVYNNNKENIIFNKNIYKEIDEINSELNLKRSKKDNISKKLIESKVNFDLYSNNINELISKRETLSGLLHRKNIYSNYLFLLSRNGMSLYILNNFIHNFNTQINSISSQILPFKLEMSLVDSNIEYNIIENDVVRSCSLSSGMEGFFIDVVTRISMYSISKKIPLNILIIDEGFGVLDIDSISKVRDLFDFIKTHYSNCIVISHSDSIKDFMDNHIYIYKENFISYIDHND